MGQFFPPPYGLIEINTFYSDNEPYCREVKFAIPCEKWSEFESSPLCREITAYVEALQTLDTQCTNCEPGYTEETGAYGKSSSPEGYYESFWARVRRELCHRSRR